MSADAVSSPTSQSGDSIRSPTGRSKRKNRMSAIRVWSDSGDQGLELLVAPHVSDEQQIASKMASLRTALDNCREQINNEPSAATANNASSDASSSHPTSSLAESNVRLRGILSELNTLDKQITNKGISYVSEESSADVTEADLPPASGDTTGKPTHRQVTAMRQLCQDLLLKSEAEKGSHGGTANGAVNGVSDGGLSDGSRMHIDSEEKVEDKRGSLSVNPTSTTVVDASSTPSTFSATSASPTPSAAASPTGADEEKAVVGATAAAAMRAEPMRNTAEGARAAAEAEQRAQNRKVGGGNGQKAANGDVFVISRWGELLREPKKPLNAQQLKKKRGQHSAAAQRVEGVVGRTGRRRAAHRRATLLISCPYAAVRTPSLCAQRWSRGTRSARSSGSR